jgi:DNA-binding MarR family transcriptional regulator
MSTTNDPAEAVTRLTLLVFRLNGLLLAEGDRMAAPVGQTSARWQVLGVVDHGPCTVAAVARTMGLARQSVQRTADLLAADGLVAYEDNPADRRAMLVRLTPRGRKALRTIEAAQQAWAARLGEALGAPAVGRACALLERLEQALVGDEAAGE